MKRIMRKNQVIITVLAVMIAIAGYLTYAGRVEVADSRDISMENTSDAKEALQSMIRSILLKKMPQMLHSLISKA